MHKDDFTYKSWLAWIEDYSKVVGGQYTSIEELPKDNWYTSQHVLMLRETPESWPAMAKVQAFIHPWNKEKKMWEPEPVAFTQGSVTPRHAVVGSLILLRSSENEELVQWDKADPTLKPGEYLIKTYLDSKEKLAKNPTAFLTHEDFAGQTHIQAHWNKTFKESEKVSVAQLKRAD